MLRLRILSLFLVFALYACATVPDKPAYGPVTLSPSGQPGSMANGGSIAVDAGGLRLEAKAMSRAEADAALSPLTSSGYVFISLKIENATGSVAVFNPARAALTDDDFTYRKPLDYTDLYDMNLSEGAMAALKGRFYDLNVTLRPGEAVNKLLLFRPISLKASRASLLIKDIQTPTGDIGAQFDFTVKK